MRMGDYTVAISGPRGVVFEALVGLSGRKFERLAIDDEALQELLVVTSVCAGAIDAELLLAQKRLSQGGPGAAGGAWRRNRMCRREPGANESPSGDFRRGRCPMKERPILFNGPMVRAILEGRKTQTRRVVKAKHLPFLGNLLGGFLDGRWNQRPLPYGKPGDRLWVREKFEVVRETCSYEVEEYDYFQWDEEFYGPPQEALKDECPRGGDRALILYASDEEEPVGWWKPSIHMPRWASRITLEVVAVRVERLQEISEADAEAEGVAFMRDYPDADETLSARQLYDILWESINGAGSWDANPWVWVIEFKRVEGGAA